MHRSCMLLTAIVIAATVGSVSDALAQNPIAQTVANAADGMVRMQFAGRPGTCGDGTDVIGYGNAIFAGSVSSFGDWTSSRCVPGPVRVALSVAGGRVTQMQTFVGGSWSRSTARVTDLGTVSPADASTFFFGIVPQLEGRANKARFLLPAVLADDARTVPRLISLANDASRSQATRRQAIQWIGLLGEVSAVPTLVSFARQGGDAPRGDDIDDDDEAPGKRGLATAAISALSFLGSGAGIPALIDLARNGGSAVWHSAVFWLGQSGDPRALSTLHAVIENTREDERVRAHAIFSLSHSSDFRAGELAYLRKLWPRLTSDKLRDAVLMGMAQDGAQGSPWLLERARDANETIKTRKSALFWAGQREATQTKDLVAFYRAVPDASLREHAIFVLSQRGDDTALNELMRIAREDVDKQMRSKAMFWLGQKDDPRVAKMISDRLTR
ncbi:MAG TPA: HEAT repeat domain-containing protein [Gemmatimonadaceae bacterium]|nr:HEAT repeat domain-containing protein [Gemmatimonadaceae bacterium]